MKKILAVVVFIASLTSCGREGNKASAITDSTSSANVDSAKSAVDSTAAKVDSTIKAVADTAESKINAITDSAKKDLKK